MTLTPAQKRYRDYLVSPHWQSVRRRIVARAQEHCEQCGCFCGEVEAVLDADEFDRRVADIEDRGETPCQVCGWFCRFRSTEDNSGRVWLEVHHRTYERVGREHDDDLVALCCYCHDEVTERQRLSAQVRQLVPGLPRDATHGETLAALVAYWLDCQQVPS